MTGGHVSEFRFSDPDRVVDGFVYEITPSAGRATREVWLGYGDYFDFEGEIILTEEFEAGQTYSGTYERP